MKNRAKAVIAFFILIYHTEARDGFYVGLGAGYANINSASQGALNYRNGENGQKNVGSIASTTYGGFDFNDYIGLQLEYDVTYGGNVANSFSISQQLAGLGLLLSFPFERLSYRLRTLSIYAKGNMNYSMLNFYNINTSCTNCVNTSNSSTLFLPSYGAGLEYNLRVVGLRFEWDYNTSNTATYNGMNQVAITSNLFLISVLYHF